MSKIAAFRLADPAYARSPAQMLSGEGALLHGGRWNSPGTRVVYLAQSLSLAAFELLVHLQRSQALRHFRVLRVELPEDGVFDVDPTELPADWNAVTGSAGTRELGDAWVASLASVALRVPSIVIPGEYNYLLNPAHEDFAQVVYGEIQGFMYDPRIFNH